MDLLPDVCDTQREFKVVYEYGTYDSDNHR